PAARSPVIARNPPEPPARSRDDPDTAAAILPSTQELAAQQQANPAVRVEYRTSRSDCLSHLYPTKNKIRRILCRSVLLSIHVGRDAIYRHADRLAVDRVCG